MVDAKALRQETGDRRQETEFLNSEFKSHQAEYRGGTATGTSIPGPLGIQ
jgi:hypothetical protein